MKLNALSPLFNEEPSEKMPVLFLGHGNPMNAIEENQFVKGFREAGKGIPKPKAIICISAHWETRGTLVTAMNNPRTIHDFGGFPKELFEVQYPAPGSPELAKKTSELITKTEVGMDHKWGLDHGAWSVIKHLYPEADVPVIQMSIDYTKPAQYHYELAAQLAELRDKGVLIIGSGNNVHNLRRVAWDKADEESYGYDWAIEANELMKKYINSGDHKSLINYGAQGSSFKLAIPTPEHYLPLIYTLGLKTESDATTMYNDVLFAGSLSMLSVRFGAPPVSDDE